MSQAIDLTTLRRELTRFLAMGPTYDSLTPDQQQQVDDCISEGSRLFYWHEPIGESAMQHTWSFLTAECDLAVSSRTTELPSDYLRENGRLAVVTAGVTEQPARVSEAKMRFLRVSTDADGPPKYYAIVNTNRDGRTVRSLVVHPTPDQEYTVALRYIADPPRLSAANPYPLGGALHSQTFLEACLTAAERKLLPEGGAGLHSQTFLRLLANSIAADQADLADGAGDIYSLSDDTTQATKADVASMIGLELGYGPTAAIWSASEAGLVEAAVRGGLRRFYNPVVLPNERFPHRWSFLKQIIQLAVGAKGEAVLPAEFEGMHDGAWMGDETRRLIGTSERHLLELAEAGDVTAEPAYYAVCTVECEGLSRLAIRLYPYPTVGDTVFVSAHVGYGNLAATDVLPLGGQPHFQTVLAACRAEAESLTQGGEGPRAAEFMRYLQASVQYDRLKSAPETIARIETTTHDNIVDRDRLWRLYR